MISKKISYEEHGKVMVEVIIEFRKKNTNKKKNKPRVISNNNLKKSIKRRR